MTAPITWAEASSPIYWSNIGINWNTPAKTDTSAFISNLGYTQLGILNIGSSVLISMSMTFSNGNSFLWNDVSDPSTIWNDVSDPTSIWTKESDPTSTWTKSDYPD